MGEAFLKKLITREFADLTVDELRLIVNNGEVFPLTKKDTKTLEKIIADNTIEDNKEKVAKVLQKGLPTTFWILSNLDKQGVKEDTIEINFREALLSKLHQMTNLQLCIFIDKVLKFGKEEKLRFFRNKDFSLHEINGVVSRSLGLKLVFEIFKAGKAKGFTAINYNQINKDMMIEVINNHAVRYLYILEKIAKVVLATDEANIFGTKINKMIKEQIMDFVLVVKKEKAAVRATGVEPKKTWTYNLCGLADIIIEDDE